MNNLRLGYTETTLLFFYYLDKNNITNHKNLEMYEMLIQYMCSTSGFYDKQINGSYFNFNSTEVKNSKTYNEYFNNLLNYLKDNNNFYLELCFQNIDDSLLSYKEDFLQYINYYHKQPKIHVYNFIENKNILIINNLGSLIKQQFECGNLKKIYPNFPDNIKSIQYFENGYTYFNNGPDNTIFETSKKLCNEINNFEFDGAIISAGAYSWLIADFILNNMKKDVFVTGMELNLNFGIANKHAKKVFGDKINEYFIEVPDKMKPEGYLKIEDGAYW